MQAEIPQASSFVVCFFQWGSSCPGKEIHGNRDILTVSPYLNGVETIPSVLRSKYNADRMPVRGRIPGRLFFDFKIAALNFGKLMTYRKKRGNYAQNPILIGN